MTKINKARFAGFMAAAALMVGASTASAQSSSAELQAQINALMAQLASLQAGQTATVTFTMDLTMGSTGPQVVALQSFLESKGFLVMPVGVAKGYFGGLTRAALARYQASVGIAPAVGYFGPITRARLNAAGTVVVPGPVVVVPGSGTEGQLENDDQLGSIA